MKSLVRTTRFTRGRLPHWEVEHGQYFVTVRCADSLPANIVARLKEIHDSLEQVGARSDVFERLQRQYFLTMEKYLDAGAGSAPLRHATAASTLISAFQDLKNEGVDVPHFCVMPNHWHALMAPLDGKSLDLCAVMTRLKGRASRAINLALDRRGPLWQREWFDRWMRDDVEWERCAEYIRQNPVKAGLARDWREHPWTR